jgi:glyoxylase-like metal-dependent hydrolase (beta-lactamase superfamily II)
MASPRAKPLTPFALLAALLLVLGGAAGPAAAQDDRFADVEIQRQQVADGLYMLQGAGGNIGALVGEDGTFLIDDQFAPLTDKIQAALGEITDRPVKYVFNTHWHGDHTGGNENFGEAGAAIVAHRNVRKRLSAQQMRRMEVDTLQAASDEALPVITFTDSVSFHLNGQTLRVGHTRPAHTDGDAVVYFPDANAVHTGDVYFAGAYPFIDLESGGSVDGVIAAAGNILDRIDADTEVIPGHGALSNQRELRAYRDMLVTVRDRMQAMIEDGRSLEEVLAAEPSAEYDAEYGQGFIGPERFVTSIYRSLTSDR